MPLLSDCRPGHIYIVIALVLAATLFWPTEPPKQLVIFRQAAVALVQPGPPAARHSQPPQDETVDKQQIERHLRSVKLSVLGKPLHSTSVTSGAAAEVVVELQLGEQRDDGADGDSEPIAGEERLDNLKELLLDSNLHSVAGDFVECGVSQGDTSIYAKAVLTAYALTEYRHIHMVDSFEGGQLETGDGNSTTDGAISQQQMTARLESYDLLDSTVHFWQGDSFRYSMPKLREGIIGSAGAICVLRADGTDFASMMDILFNAYDIVGLSGYVIVANWRIKECRAAVKLFFELHTQSVKVMPVHNVGGGYFKKTKNFEVNMTWYQQFNDAGRQIPRPRRRKRKGKKRRTTNPA